MKLPKEFLKSAKKCNYDVALMQKAKVSHLYIEKNNILSFYAGLGLKITAKNFSQGVKIKMLAEKGVKIREPIFFCFGVLEEKGRQIIIPEIVLEEGSEAEILAHCTFPRAKNVFHKMKAKIKLEKGARLFYQEKHYHGENFGAEVLPSFKVLIDKNASFENEFVLNKGSVGKLKLFLEAELGKEAFCEISNRIVGKGQKDEIEVYDKILLIGENSRSLNRIKGVAANGGKIFFKGEAEAGEKAKNAQGHIDCQEIIIGNSIAQSVPIVRVKNPQARITHEASVGKISQKELETLMTRGLSEKEAVNFVIRGIV